MMYDLVLKHCFYTLGNKLLVLYSTDWIILLKVPVSEADKYLRYEQENYFIIIILIIKSMGICWVGSVLSS